MRVTWDIFCSVVDNYGDIGVTWRLARQLVAEHECAVRLWVDDLAAFARVCPQADAQALVQWQAGVEVRHWPQPWQACEPAAVVIEAFACSLPGAYVEAMAAKAVRPLWLNLEYLSAEDWVGGCHGLPSLQPGGLQKFFFFPGFTAATGGLLREAALLAERCAFQADAAAQAAFLASLGVERLAGAQLVSLFAYENGALAEWLSLLSEGAVPTQLLVPEGRVLADVQAWLGVGPLQAGAQHRRGALQVQVLPFVEQAAYDRLLWSCELNLVRGEDSFVRAQWAGRPMLWHIYPQEEGAHWDKLEAFLAHYCASLSPQAASALRAAWHAWNAGSALAQAWPAVQAVWPELLAHAEQWCELQAARPDLARRLEQFYRNWLSYAA
ncbi:conserved hypothetical protein, PP_1857 family [Pseudomonas cuatrocienegasensis]|uniref:Protein-arginine rhamnosyltransferase n=1 Tax=Pseudomonas cuatrocienegasensis TaxID=543360 RepID=A0ABY1BRX4_9PSED|nr:MULTISPECIES: elongation factor P maturation arginine rhamnosyltransferase EarP [Pseudomonas]OEC32544.1 hypothetical protein A7D25_23590 [Pseudomonas sp. 21C1]SER48892.1 conserved hypothetical protein, PP_1857 family [Pseudomonas cuatrocienegasensis]